MSKRIGLITYDNPHLKTEQIFQRLWRRPELSFKFYALKFTPRPARETLISHRPNQEAAAHPRALAQKHNVPYTLCDTDADIENDCDAFLIVGAGILSPDAVKGKKLVNCHPGIIPAMRGLDSFKWAIRDQERLGVTLHYIDERVDAGEIISIVETPVYAGDTIDTLARRHYELEIDMLSRFDEFIANPTNPFADAAEGKAHMRMPMAEERTMLDGFNAYVEKFATS